MKSIMAGMSIRSMYSCWCTSRLGARWSSGRPLRRPGAARLLHLRPRQTLTQRPRTGEWREEEGGRRRRVVSVFVHVAHVSRMRPFALRRRFL